MTNKLSEKSYWNKKHKNSVSSDDNKPGSWPNRVLDYFLKGILKERWDRKYSDWFVWDVIYPAYLSDGLNGKILEIGSAPGHHLVRFAEMFGMEPFGIEYAEDGVIVNKETFVNKGFDPNNVIHADFFSDEIMDEYQSYFDVVISRGFIEHFDDPKSVVSRHVNLLKPGGRIIVAIPNIRGLNYIVCYFLDKHVIDIHNLNIMSLKAFKKIFDDIGLECQFCDYCGTFETGIYSSDGSSFSNRMKRILGRIQRLLNLVLFTIAGRRGLDCRWWSPYLYFIGKKL